MSQSGLDARHGRQGGRVGPWVTPYGVAKQPPCAECGQPIISGSGTRHLACEPEPEPDAQPSLFDPE